jgi:hypothetical protein
MCLFSVSDVHIPLALLLLVVIDRRCDHLWPHKCDEDRTLILRQHIDPMIGCSV